MAFDHMAAILDFEKIKNDLTQGAHKTSMMKNKAFKA